MRKQDFEDDEFILKHLNLRERNLLQWCENVGMTAWEIENVATGVGISGERLRELFEVELYKRMYGRFKGTAGQSNETGWDDYRIFEGEDNGTANCDGSTHDNIKPG